MKTYKQTHQKKFKFVVNQGRDIGGGKLDEGSQKILCMSNYTINKS